MTRSWLSPIWSLPSSEPLFLPKQRKFAVTLVTFMQKGSLWWICRGKNRWIQNCRSRPLHCSVSQDMLDRAAVLDHSPEKPDYIWRVSGGWMLGSETGAWSWSCWLPRFLATELGPVGFAGSCCVILFYLTKQEQCGVRNHWEMSTISGPRFWKALNTVMVTADVSDIRRESLNTSTGALWGFGSP